MNTINKLNENSKKGVEVPVFNVGVPMPPIKPCSQPKAAPQRNDRFREFEGDEGVIFNIDGKSITMISANSDLNGYISIIVDKHYVCVSQNKYVYNEIIEWWHYWKQN